MAKIDTLQPKLYQVAVKEQEMYCGDMPRQFFIEIFPADSLDKLLEEFTPDYHNSKWEAEDQKLHQNKPDIDKLIKHRRAVAYMFSGKQCVFKHYWETELTTHVIGHSRMLWVRNELEQLKITQEEGNPMWYAKES